MSYIGNNPDVNAFTVSVERFSGNASCTQFQLSRTNYNDNAAIEVVISGAQQDPTANYGVQNGLITFTSAPPVGSNNIVVTYRAPIVVTFNQVTPSQLQANSVTQTAVAENSITSSKILNGAVTGNKIAVGAVRANSIANGSITGEVFADGVIRVNNIIDGQVFGNTIGVGAVSGNHIAAGAVSGNNIGLKSINASNSIVDLSITGNLIGTGAISANNFAGGGVTSNVLSSNLQISTVRVAETVNVFTTGIGGNVNIDIANATVYYFVANTTANVTFNFRANSDLSLNNLLGIGQTASVAIALKQGSVRYRANVFIDGNRANGIYWLGNSQPLYQTSQSQSIDSYSFTIIKTASETFTVMASNATFGQANGQGVTASGSVY